MNEIDIRTQSDIVFKPILDPTMMKKLRDLDPEQWITNRKATLTDYKDLEKKMLESPNSESKCILTAWSNTLIREDMRSEVYQVLSQVYLAGILKNCDANYRGNMNELTAEEAIFIGFSAENFRDLVEIYIVNELGYTDIWLVFPLFDDDTILTKIQTCQDFLDKHKMSDFHYRILCPDNFCGVVDKPLLHIKFRRDSIGS